MTPATSLPNGVHKPTAKVTYDCFPVTAQRLGKPHGPLPLQTSTLANLEWASVFLDHAGHLIKAREQKYEELAKRYNAALNTIGQNNTDIEKLATQNVALNHKIENLHADVDRRKSAYGRLDEAFDRFRSRAKAEKGQLTKELDATRRKLNAAQSSVKAFEAKLLEADEEAHEAWVHERLSDVEDHKVIEDLHQALERETKANALLQEKLDETIKQLLATKQDLQAVTDKQTVSEREITELKERIEELKQEIADRDRTIGRQESDLVQLRESAAALTAEKTQLSTDLANKIAELQKKEQDLTAAQQEAAGLNVLLSEQAGTIQELSAQLQDQKDETANLRAQSEKTTSELLEKINKLIKHDEEDEQKLTDLGKELERLSTALNKALVDDESDKSTINNLNEVQRFLETKIGKLTTHDAKDEVQIKNLKKALATLEANLKNTAEQKKASENELKKRIESLQQTIEEVKSDDANDKDTINTLKQAQQIGEKAIEELKAQVAAAQKEAADAKQKAADEEAARKSAEAAVAAAAKAAAEHEQSHKPQLPNDVKLANPIALVGSLKGAPRDVDDESFYINCSFPVKLFNVTSNKIYISSNGLFTLDHASEKYDYQKFPYRGWVTNPLPDHVLAPFWADLYIYKNTPQGIYYEETGSAPNRKLEVEWYVSRYNSPKEYYHFSLVVEEAKPNVATFKYFEALDKGGKCTIGIQGPKTSSMFSYNEQKALPGTQVIFDTSKTTFTTSKFKIPEATTKPVVNGNGATVVKPGNAVRATVKEVV